MTNLKDRPKATHYTLREGGVWIPLIGMTDDGPKQVKPLAVFAVKFENGSIWDPISGWREEFKGDTSK